jgi:hypothetical protein
MPMLTREELARVEPRWPENQYNIDAPEFVCGDWACDCADWARENMTDGEYQLAFGVPKEYGLDPEEAAAYLGGTAVTMTGGYNLPPFQAR